jgi:hypothetical protein
MIGPHPHWEDGMQRHGRREMALRLRDEGAAAAAGYATRFERFANEWLAWHGYDPAFVFRPVALPTPVRPACRR